MESWCFGGNFLWDEAPSIGRRRKPLCLINTRLYKSIQKKLLLLLWGYTCSKIFFWLYRGLQSQHYDQHGQKMSQNLVKYLLTNLHARGASDGVSLMVFSVL